MAESVDTAPPARRSPTWPVPAPAPAHPGDPVHAVAELMLISGPLRVPLLRDAFGRLAGRHDALRAADLGDGIAAGVDFDAVAAPAEPDERRRRAAVLRWAAEPRWRRFAPAGGPSWRVGVLSLGPADHALLVCARRGAADRRSLRVVLDEAGRLYSSAVEGRRAELPPLTPLAQGRPARPDPASIAARVAALDGLPAGIELPADRRRPAALSFAGARLAVDLDAGLAARVGALARAHQTTADAVLLGAFAVLVHRYTGARDIPVGVPDSGADSPAGVVGPLTNLLVVRLDLSGEPSLRELLARAGRATADAYAHRQVPFEALVDRLWPNASQRPLCQLGFEVRPVPSCPLAGATATPLPLDEGVAAFDLGLVWSGGSLAVEYDTDLFDRDSVERLAANLRTLLAGLVDAPDEPVGRVPLLDPAEAHRLAVDWTDTRVDFPLDRLVHQLVAEQAARRPDATALVAGDRRCRYRELDRDANRVANRLRQLGVGPGVPVGVRMGRSIEMVVGALGVLKAGGAVLLLDPAQPAERLGFMLGDTRAPVVLTAEALLAGMPAGYRGQVLCLDRDRDFFAQAAADDPAVPVHPESLCQIAYTSGSTGQPRGVAFRHGAVLLVSRGTQRAYSLTDADRGTWLSAPGFGISFVNELWPFLSIGGTVHIADEATANSPFGLRDWLLANEITVTVLAKVHAERVCAVDWPAGAPLRVLMVSGERVGWLGSALPFEVVTIYGSTETTNATTCFNAADGVRVTPKSVPPERRYRYGSPIGRAVPNARVYVLDDDLRLVPIGVPGQVFVGGALIQAGYVDRPAETAQKWLPDPYAPGPGARMVATGDIGRVSADGTIDLLGRADDQVSLNGYRIEPGEVAALLGEHGAVREAAVVVREDEPGQRRLVGYVVPQPLRRPSGAELRDLLRERLPAYMVPASVVVLDALPRLPNGKVDRTALPAPGSTRVDRSPYVEPRTPVEAALVDVWRQVLHLDRVGVQDDYFELGGDSLTGMDLMASIGAVLGVDLPLNALFDAPTVERLARTVEAA